MGADKADGSGTELAPRSDPRLANLRPPWKPGESGNKAGGAGKLARVLREYIAGPDGVNTKADVDAIRELAKTARSEFVKFQARTWLAEQVVGKASQPLSLEDEDGNKVRVGVIMMPMEREDGE